LYPVWRRYPASGIGSDFAVREASTIFGFERIQVLSLLPAIPLIPTIMERNRGATFIARYDMGLSQSLTSLSFLKSL
jgi:hypothetical protein